MLRDEYFRRLINGAHIELYLSANDGARVFWPWRMQPPREASQNYRDACEKYIIDSHIADPSVTTNECLDAAFKYNAEIVALVDYLPFDVYERELDPEEDQQAWEAFQQLKKEYDSAYTATLGSLTGGLEQYHDHPFDGEVLIPLQKPWVDCWQDIGEPANHILGIGGLKDGGNSERIEASQALRQAVGPYVWIHGFGWGPDGLADEIRANPDLIDSIDYSTPMQNAATDNCTPGKERMSVAAMGSARKLVRDLREVSEYPTKQTPDAQRSKNQSGIGAFL